MTTWSLSCEIKYRNEATQATVTRKIRSMEIGVGRWIVVTTRQRPGLRMDAVDRTRTLFRSESSPGFRENLAEREESIPLSTALFPKAFF